MDYTPLDFSVSQKFEQFLQNSKHKSNSTFPFEAHYSWSKLTHNRVFGVYDLRDPASRRKYYEDVAEAEYGMKLFYQSIQLRQYFEKHPHMSQYVCRPFMNYRPDGQEESSNETEVSTISTESEAWSNLKVSRDQIDIWKERLRKYLVQTILARLDEIVQIIEQDLVKASISWNKIGISSLNNLKAENFPELHKIMPFLAFSSNFGYVVQRLGELSSGGCLSSYKWNSGGDYQGTKWNESFPTDSSLIMHFFCTYMDHILPAHPLIMKDRPFSNGYFISTFNKSDFSELKEGLYLVELSINPPRYDVFFQGELANLNSGPSNIFQAILLFFYILKTRNEGMLGKLNLGRSGMNFLWIFED